MNTAISETSCSQFPRLLPCSSWAPRRPLTASFRGIAVLAAAPTGRRTSTRMLVDGCPQVVQGQPLNQKIFLGTPACTSRSMCSGSRNRGRGQPQLVSRFLAHAGLLFVRLSEQPAAVGAEPARQATLQPMAYLRGRGSLLLSSICTCNVVDHSGYAARKKVHRVSRHGWLASSTVNTTLTGAC